MTRFTLYIVPFLFILPLPWSFSSANGLFYSELFYAYTATALSALLIHQTVLYRNKENGSFSPLDKALLLFILYITGHLIFHGDEPAGSMEFLKGGVLLLAYLWTRKMPDKRGVLYAILLSGIVEAITAILQSTGWAESENAYFNVTGHLSNPGPLGGYLSICLVIALSFLKESFHIKKRGLTGLLVKGIGILIVGVLATGCWLSDSRAAFLSVLTGSLFLFPVSRRFSALLKKRNLVIATLSGILLIGTLLYFYRPQSAHARLLIWRVSSGMVAEHPLTGIGIGEFPRTYMLHQAAHFETERSDQETLVAGDAAYTYNELLHLTVETGIIGLLLILCIVIIISRGTPHNPINRTIQSSLMAWGVFSCFSYPTAIPPLYLLFPFLLGCLQYNSITSYSDKIVSYFNKKHSYILYLLMLLGIGMAGIREGMFYKQASEKMISIFSQNKAPALEYARTHYSRLKSNTTFNLTYSQWMLRHATDTLNQNIIEEMLPTPESYILLGNYYAKTKQYEKAEHTYKTAARMVPTRLMPNYKLWRLYEERGDSMEALLMAKTILSQPVKVTNSFTINAKREAEEFIFLRENLSPPKSFQDSRIE